MKKIIVGIFLLLIFSLATKPSFAADYRSNYQVEYTLSQDSGSLSSKVNFTIQITNLRSDIYVSRFAISFPKTFLIHDLQASDDNGAINPHVSADDAQTKIEMDFSNPKTGKDSTNNFYLQFYQDNLFKVNGNVWEVILPTIEDKQNATYKVTVNLPAVNSKKISIAKPKPDEILGNKIIWNNPQTKTIYAVFGEAQIYQLELTYHIKNPKITPVFTDVAFPPDTAYQKIYVQSITPAPNSVSQDEDGNFLGRYILAPAETKDITFIGQVEISSKPRSEVVEVERDLIGKQKDYLLTAQNYWNLKSINKIENLKSAGDIYYFVTNSLKYNYKRATKTGNRLGAETILSKPDQAVCTEFTDLFVATSREKGIMARELEGFGNSSDPTLRPLSLLTDVLHTWPQYFDSDKGLWVEVDPTWENTSGIDYFSSLDLNHIVFAIHGKRSDYPLPAGMYKTENSRDILVKATTTKPQEITSILLDRINTPSRISDNTSYKVNLKISNRGNTFVWNIPVEATGQNLDLSWKKITIATLAPWESKEVKLDYASLLKNKRGEGTIDIAIAGKKVFAASILIFPYYISLSLKIALIVMLVSAVFFITKYGIFKRR